MNDNDSVRGRWTWVAASAAGVLLWRAAAFRWPSSIVGIADGLQLPLALFGVLFLTAGVGAWWVRPDRWTTVFLLYGLCLGVHWGGAIGASDVSLEMSLFWVYLACTAVGDAAILHLALIYPHAKELALPWRIALYSPAAFALLLAPATALIPDSTLESFAGLVLLVANLFSLAAGFIFLTRLFTTDAATRRAARLPLIATGMVSGSVLALLGAGGALPGVPEAWNLALAAVPITLAAALVTREIEPPMGEQPA